MQGRDGVFGRLRHYIWDFDGTLFDSYPMMIQCLRSALAEFGHDAAPTEVMNLMLNNVAFAIDTYADRFGIPIPDLCAVYDKYRDMAEVALESMPMEGVEEVLSQIESLGGRHYIFTHRIQANTEAYLKKHGLLSYFQAVLGPDSPGFAWKPAPDAILHLMKEYHMDPAETVMIGDRFIDLESGRQAGVKTAHLVCAMAPEDLECDWRFLGFGSMLKGLQSWELLKR